MVTRERIGEFEFVAQTTYYMYVPGNEKPVLVTSDMDLFEKQKNMAKEGKITARKGETETMEL